MNLLMLSNLYPKDIENEIRSKLKFNMYDAANELQWNIIDGLVENRYFENVKLCNLIPIDSWPGYYKDHYVKKHLFNVDGKSSSVSIPFCNIKLLKHKSIEYSFINNAVRLFDDDCVILIYSLNATFLKAVKKLKGKCPNLRCIAVVADLPQFTTNDNNIFRRFYRMRNVANVQSLIKYVDGFIFLTEHMSKKLNVDKPFKVVEGIAKENPYRNSELRNVDEVSVLYSGSLNKLYGVMHLIDAFELIRGDNFRLYLCGMGDAEKEIKEMASRDNRIVFLGKITHDEVLKLQCKAHVLVNPRQNIHEFTKYSFPSKNLEYLASGTPVVAYNLDGIPKEYDRYLIYPQDDSIEALAYAIERAAKVKDFDKITDAVLLYKNKRFQSKKIIDLFEELR